MVIAIIAILAAILFPVFAQAKLAGKKAVFASSYRQVAMGISMYASDNDDAFAPANQTARLPGWFYCFGCGRPDYTWVELTQPYIKAWNVQRCPIDSNATDQGLALDPMTNQPLNSTDPNYYYAWAARSNIGLNYIFLSPWYASLTGAGSEPISMSRITQPSNTIATIDTMWYRDMSTGAPKGGGNWIAEAPCVRDSSGNYLVPTSNIANWYSYGGWNPNPTGQAPFRWSEFGGAFPWFNKRFTTGFADGHVKSLSVGEVAKGCDVRPSFGGAAYDGDAYKWDLR